MAKEGHSKFIIRRDETGNEVTSLYRKCPCYVENESDEGDLIAGFESHLGLGILRRRNNNN